VQFISHHRSPSVDSTQVGYWLNLTRAIRSDLGIADAVAKGLTVRAVEPMAKLLGRELIVGPNALLSRATFDRKTKEDKPLSKDTSETLYAMARVLSALSRVYHEDQDAILRFMKGPHPLLEGRTPYEVARSSIAGAEVVLRLIDRLDAGIAA